MVMVVGLGSSHEIVAMMDERGKVLVDVVVVVYSGYDVTGYSDVVLVSNTIVVEVVYKDVVLVGYTTVVEVIYVVVEVDVDVMVVVEYCCGKKDTTGQRQMAVKVQTFGQLPEVSGKHGPIPHAVGALPPQVRAACVTILNCLLHPSHSGLMGMVHVTDFLSGEIVQTFLSEYGNPPGLRPGNGSVDKPIQT